SLFENNWKSKHSTPSDSIRLKNQASSYYDQVRFYHVNMLVPTLPFFKMRLDWCR
ncbi:hypothetical protein PanWU01x14_357260, partial [Parasponia andersonii]